MITEVTQPAVEPVSLDDALSHLRVEQGQDDLTVLSLITAARQHVENVTGYAMVQRQFRLTLDYFPSGDRIILPRSNLLAIDSVQYVDRDGNTQTWDDSNYTTGEINGEGCLVLDPDSDWPTVKEQRDAVTITYTAGYASLGDDDAGNIPLPLKQAMLLLIGHWYENREAVNVGTSVTPVPMAVDALLFPYRRMYL